MISSNLLKIRQPPKKQYFMKEHAPFLIKKSVLLLIILFISTTLFPNSFENTYKNTPSSVDKVVGTINSFSPSTGHAGTVVTINGPNGDFTITSTVTLNGFAIPAANINYIVPNKLEVTIPCGSSSGFFSVDGGAPSDLFTYIAPTVDPVLNQTYCVNTSTGAIALTGTPLPGDITDGQALTFDWTNDNVNIGLASSGTGGTSIPTFTATNVTLEPITATITITPVIDGCSGVSKEYEITINPKPVMNSITDITACPGENISLIALTASSPFSGTGSSFTWSGNNNAAIGLGQPSGIGSPIPAISSTVIPESFFASMMTNKDNSNNIM